MGIPLKQWILQQARSEGRTYAGIYARMRDGLYPGLKLERVNQRVVFVLNPKCRPVKCEGRTRRPKGMGRRGRTVPAGAPVFYFDDLSEPVRGDALERLAAI
ncbi:MAG: hypothetical protein ABFD89_06785 [Bryobacteraceae bacterium]